MAKPMPKMRKLDTNERSENILAFEELLSSYVVGQPEAVTCMTHAYQKFISGMSQGPRPVAVYIFAGVTGSGKTLIVEKSAQILLGDENSVTKVDCAEFQHSHEIAKLIGAPPGYMGYNESPGVLSQKEIDKHQTERAKLNFILFDEVEKASPALHQLMLGILDKGRLTMGNSSRTSFERSIIVMTTNLGAKEIQREFDGTGTIGFGQQRATANDINRIADDAVRKTFSPEFMNRVDRIVVFNQLKRAEFFAILDLELANVQDRLLHTSYTTCCALIYTEAAKTFLVDKGTDARYGARELKRAVEKYVVMPLTNLLSTNKIPHADVVTVDVDDDHPDSRLAFFTQTLPNSRKA